MDLQRLCFDPDWRVRLLALKRCLDLKNDFELSHLPDWKVLLYDQSSEQVRIAALRLYWYNNFSFLTIIRSLYMLNENWDRSVLFQALSTLCNDQSESVRKNVSTSYPL